MAELWFRDVSNPRRRSPAPRAVKRAGEPVAVGLMPHSRPTACGEWERPDFGIGRFKCTVRLLDSNS
ncbi:MAG: hypothetical protein KME26_08630 [Oscillatoria princeps RMCB-10]|nr:hypothetical protein [Oscillatoria princeps RMCB-10]